MNLGNCFHLGLGTLNYLGIDIHIHMQIYRNNCFHLGLGTLNYLGIDIHIHMQIYRNNCFHLGLMDFKPFRY